MTSEDKTTLMARTKTWRIDQVITGSVGLIHGHGGVTALMEYRPNTDPEADAPLPTTADIGHLSPWSVFVARYDPDFTTWRVTPCNVEASAFVPEPTTMSEAEWVALLHRLRDATMSPGSSNVPQKGPSA